MLPEYLKFVVLKLSHAPEIKKLRCRQGEHRVLTETWETKVIDCSSVRAHWKVREAKIFSSGAAGCRHIHPTYPCWKPSGSKIPPPSGVWSRLHQAPPPCTLECTSTRASPLENQCNRPLLQKTSIYNSFAQFTDHRRLQSFSSRGAFFVFLFFNVFFFPLYSLIFFSSFFFY